MGRDEAPDIRRFGWATAASAKLVTLAARVGADPLESGDAALQRLVMVLMAVGVLPLTILWSVVYFAAGAPLAAAAPAVYSVATPINTALFAWTRNLRLYRFIQLLMTLVLPWLVTMSLGGFRNSSAVIIWAALCPLVSLLVEDLRQTVLWIVGFLLLLIVSAVLEPSLKPPELPEAFVTWFFVLNLGAVIAVVFALLYYFVAQRNFFQQRSETLLLNILPKEISDALKVDRSAIAAHYKSASVLFADVVGFTPMAAAMAPLRLVNLLNEVFSSLRRSRRKARPRKDQDDRRLLYGRGGGASRAGRSRARFGAARSRHAGSGGEPDIRRRDACVPHRRQFRAGGRRRDRPQEVHLRSLGRDGEPGEPHGIARAKRGDPDHAQHLRSGRR